MNTTPAPLRKAQAAGYTLVELLVVLTLALLVLGLAFARVGGGQDRRAERRFVQDFVIELHAARLAAMRSGTCQPFHVDAESRRFGIVPGKEIPGNIAIFIGEDAGTTTEFGTQFLFFPDGSWAGSNFRIVADGVRNYAVSIDALSGMARAEGAGAAL